jgi:peptidoglycan/xylan/chitin deacetylase (PgdA/CDA1 family)
MYHNISYQQASLSSHTITPDQFESDLAFIYEKGYTPITMTKLINYILKGSELPQKPVIITFDDGFESVYNHAYPILIKYNACAVVPVVGAYIDYFSDLDHNTAGYTYLSWEKITEMSKSPNIELQDHSYNMHNQSGSRIGVLKKTDETFAAYRTALMEDLSKNGKLIFKCTGTKPNTFAAPYGYITEETKGIIGNMGYSAILTYEPKVNTVSRKEDLMNLGRFSRPHGISSEDFFSKILIY